ncbi:MAG TPA: tetratricopeptide repeat protein [Terriglobia bacterium]|jgi:tetratricopeptide (TPR) repeat protein
MKAISAVLLVFTISTAAIAQIEEARQAMDRGENVRAINILSDALASKPTPDIYLELANAYGRTKDYQRAEDTLREGSKRYPHDARFHNQLADLFLDNNDSEAAKSELHSALSVDPNNNYASDLLATIDMSEGEVQSALRSWNKGGRPLINDILHNYYLRFGSWVVRDAVAFHPSGVLSYSEWKTTESRLFETENFTNAGLEIEPTQVPDQYNAVVRTTTKSNSLSNIAFDLLKGAPIETSYFDLWNIGNSGLNFNSDYRWETGRRRADAQFKMPIPVPGLLYLEAGDTWRFERWDLTTIQPQNKAQALFDYKSIGPRIHITAIPQYRLELGAGFEYRNRNAKGTLPQLFTGERKMGMLTADASLRLIDRRYENRLHLEGFASRRSIIGDTQFSGGTAQLDNRLTLSKDTRTYLDWTVKGGTSRGNLPVEQYFMLGLDIYSENPLRAHRIQDHGHYGTGPMGTDFVLVNNDIERRLATIPFFNTFDIPYVTVKWQAFFDGAKTWDRNHIFDEGRLLLDVGGGVRFETPTHALNLIYGRSLRDGQNLFFAYYERRLW